MLGALKKGALGLSSLCFSLVKLNISLEWLTHHPHLPSTGGKAALFVRDPLVTRQSQARSAPFLIHIVFMSR
jgi:hypothetical protein